MGSVCCIASKDATTSEGPNGENLRRTIQYSPSWGVRWDNRGRVAEEELPVPVIFETVRRNNRSENKSEFFEPLPEVPILEDNLESNLPKSPLIRECVGTQSKAHISESPETRSITMEVKGIMGMPAAQDRTISTMSSDVPSASYLSTSPLTPISQLAHAGSVPTKWSPPTPGSEILRQGSDSQLYGPVSPSNYSASEEIPSPLLPVSSIEFTRGSHGGSLGSHPHKLAQSHSQKSDSNSNELKSCLGCSKYLVEKSSFSSQKIVPNIELSVVAILICGHVYHADCLEHLTPEISKYDPPCPVCTFGQQQAMRMFEKALKAEMDMKYKNKKHRNRIVNSDSIPLSRGSSLKLEPSSSLRNTFARPFLKRHFSFGSNASKRTLPWSKSGM